MNQSRNVLAVALALVSSVCSSFVLTACLNFGECSSDEDCGGDVCSAGQCVQCEADSDCDDGETCQDNLCEDAGGNTGGITGGCDGDEDCVEGQTCNIDQGTCGAAPIGETFLCCAFIDEGVSVAFECPDETAATQCAGGGSDACSQNPARDNECRPE